jgi:hypothetical protein
MDGRNIEPRTVLWAVAEVAWEDPPGTPYRAPATLEDTSPSVACIRLKKPISIGCRLIVKWKREQFSAIARNCRSDGKDFLLGVRRDKEQIEIKPPSKETAEASALATRELARGAPKDLPQLSTKALTPAKQETARKDTPHQIPFSRPFRPYLSVLLRLRMPFAVRRHV